MLGSITGASRTACMAARTSFKPLPVFITTTGSSDLTMPCASAFFKPANAVEPAEVAARALAAQEEPAAEQGDASAAAEAGDAPGEAVPETVTEVTAEEPAVDAADEAGEAEPGLTPTE